ncbi:MAG: tRNA pseudouridine(38-40) synthase TruA [Peptococcaceae bacterium]|jgi:tRNA pseudouridine38-40 synthase|nr:tRNA pseudouridine(38-40) synthase TruA [Peptococcaceae bacterium]
MANIRLRVAYDGTCYHGFQSQRGTGLATVQECLEKALTALTGDEVQVTGAGRTDAGVHALGQVVNFHTGSAIPPDRYVYAARARLPRDIVVRDSRLQPEDFHARFDAKGKIYRYFFYCHRGMNPFFRHYACHVPESLDVEAMRRGAAHFLGAHDFEGFCAKDPAVPMRDYTRTVWRMQIRAKGPLLVLTVGGNGFLWNMVRIIGGTLLEVGTKKRAPDSIPELILSKKRALAGKTLPPQGLFLWQVQY